MTNRGRLLIALAGAVGACPAISRAQNATWTASAGSGTWNTAGNWTPAVVPNGSTFDVFLNQALTGAYTVSLDLNVTERDLSVTHLNATLDLTTRSITLNRNLTVNEGTIRSTGGGGLTVGGTTTIRGNGKVLGVPLHTNGTLVFLADDGPIDIDDTDIDHAGVIASWGGAGDLRFNGGATLSIGAGATFTINTTGSATWNGAGTTPLITNLGTMVKAASTGTTTLSGPSLNNQGTLRIDLGSELRFLAPATLLNFSSGTLTGGVFNLFDTLRFPGAAISTLKANVTLDGAAGEIVNSTGASAFGPLSLLDAGATLSLRNGKVLGTNSGVTIAGTLIVDSGAVFTAGGPISVSPTGAILGTGTVSSGLTSSAGAISPGFSPGALNFNGNLQLQNGSRIRFEIGGPGQGFDYDLIRVSGFVGISPTGATCDVRIINGFVPPIGSFYDVMLFQDRTGQFAQFTGLRAGQDRRFVPEYFPDRLRLTVVFDPCAGADFNGDGVIDFFDYLDFAAAFSAGDDSADFNADGQVDFFDYLDFAAVFAQCTG